MVVADGNGDLAALLGDVIGRRQIVATKVEGLVEGSQLVLPLLSGVAFLPLRKGLDYHLTGHVKASDAVEGIGFALHVADVTVFIQTEVDHHRESSAGTVAGIVG